MYVQTWRCLWKSLVRGVHVGLFCGYVGLFCGDAGLFCGYIYIYSRWSTCGSLLWVGGAVLRIHTCI